MSSPPKRRNCESDWNREWRSHRPSYTRTCRSLAQVEPSRPCSIGGEAPSKHARCGGRIGDLFVTVNREWLQGLAKTAEEAIPNGTIIPDEDAQHSDVNSPVHRQLRHYLFATDTPFALPDRIASSLLNRTVQDTLNGKKGAIHNLNLSSPGSPTRAMTIQESKEVQEFHVFRRGNPLDRGNLVQPRFLSILADKSEPVIFRPGQRRLDLAKAIVSRTIP